MQRERVLDASKGREVWRDGEGDVIEETGEKMEERREGEKDGEVSVDLTVYLNLTWLAL